jgi:HPt (histidine-containing phosphotransfer) domain-containing protein
MSEKSQDFFFELRLRFLSEGREASALLLQTPAESLDLATVKSIVHSWAGIGGMLDCPQITMQARIIEQLIREPYEGSSQQIWNALKASHQFFCERLNGLFALERDPTPVVVAGQP